MLVTIIEPIDIQVIINPKFENLKQTRAEAIIKADHEIVLNANNVHKLSITLTVTCSHEHTKDIIATGICTQKMLCTITQHQHDDYITLFDIVQTIISKIEDAFKVQLPMAMFTLPQSFVNESEVGQITKAMFSDLQSKGLYN